MHYTVKLTQNQFLQFHAVLQFIQGEEYVNDIKELARLSLRTLANRVANRTWETRKHYMVQIKPAEKIALKLYQANLTEIYDFSVVQAVVEPILKR